MMLWLFLPTACLLLLQNSVSGFVLEPGSGYHTSERLVTKLQTSAKKPPASSSRLTRLSMFHGLENVMTSQIIATIDADIAKIPDNEFGLVFAGGIAVMIGGLLSAVFVGTIVDSKDLYADIVAESYAQGAQDEEFWKGLSDEEKIKAQEMLERIKASKEGGEKPTSGKSVAASTNATPSASATKQEAEKPVQVATTQPNKEVDMFSDYADSS